MFAQCWLCRTRSYAYDLRGSKPLSSTSGKSPSSVTASRTLRSGKVLWTTPWWGFQQPWVSYKGFSSWPFSAKKEPGECSGWTIPTLSRNRMDAQYRRLIAPTYCVCQSVQHAFLSPVFSIASRNSLGTLTSADLVFWAFCFHL